jgi:hypothetical protein
MYKNFRNADYVAFNEFMKSQIWSDLFAGLESVNDMWRKLNQVTDGLTDGLTRFVPDCSNKQKSKKVIYPEYLNKMLLKKSYYYKNFANKCKMAIEKYQVKKEMSYLKIKKKNF